MGRGAGVGAACREYCRGAYSSALPVCCAACCCRLLPAVTAGAAAAAAAGPASGCHSAPGCHGCSSAPFCCGLLQAAAGCCRLPRLQRRPLLLPASAACSFRAAAGVAAALLRRRGCSMRSCPDAPPAATPASHCSFHQRRGSVLLPWLHCSDARGARGYGSCRRVTGMQLSYATVSGIAPPAGGLYVLTAAPNCALHHGRVPCNAAVLSPLCAAAVASLGSSGKA
jgi:hypothetical protein